MHKAICSIGREAELSYLGITVIRFTNQEIFNNLPCIVEKIEQSCNTLEELQEDPL